jgi:hypothetical protein
MFQGPTETAIPNHEMTILRYFLGKTKPGVINAERLPNSWQQIKHKKSIAFAALTVVWASNAELLLQI